MRLFEDIIENVVRGHSDSASKYPPDLVGKSGVKDLVQRALDQKMAVSSILKEALIP